MAEDEAWIQHELDPDNGYWSDDQKPYVEAIESGISEDVAYAG